MINEGSAGGEKLTTTLNSYFHRHIIIKAIESE